MGRFSRVAFLLTLGVGACSTRQTAAPAGSANVGSGAPLPTRAPDAAVAQPPGRDASTSPPTPGTADTAQAPGVIHGDKWQDDDEQGAGMKGYKETWLYVDGEPRAVLELPEFPPIPIAWRADKKELDFVAAEGPPTYRPYWVRQWRVSDFLVAAGVPLAKVKMVYLHGGGGVIAVPGADLRKFAKDFTFDLTGNSLNKARFFFPAKMPHFGTFDRYYAVSVIVDKPVLALDEHKHIVQDGAWVNGIPYHGAPERGGIRIYRDGRLALVIKRNTLGQAGRLVPTEPKWDLGKVLAANGASSDGIEAADIVYRGERKRVDAAFLHNVYFATNAQASGEILLGAQGLAANALLLYSKGHVPPVTVMPPHEVFEDPYKK